MVRDVPTGHMVRDVPTGHMVRGVPTGHARARVGWMTRGVYVRTRNRRLPLPLPVASSAGTGWTTAILRMTPSASCCLI